MNQAPPEITQAPPIAIPRQTPDTKDLMRFELEKKSAGVALLLCWLFGVFGVHRFYLRRSHGLTMLLITLLSIPLCFVLIGFAGLIVTWIWMVVDLFQVSVWTKEHNTAVLARIQAGR